MKNHHKLAAVIIGLSSILAARYGIDLESREAALLIDAALALLTAFGVYQLPNTPK